jgi:O-antigen biosynthesis protein
MLEKNVNCFEIENNFKVLIYKIENEIDIENNLKLFLYFYEKSMVDIDYILKIINQYSKIKEKLLNLLAITFYNIGMYDNIIALLAEAYHINPENDDTLYNLGNMLYIIGENELAIKYLEQIKNKSLEIKNLILTIENVLINNQGVKSTGKYV